jgi:hypothetical protein
VDEGKLCKASGKRFCSPCMDFTKCSVCQQEYSTKSLTDGKCPACNNLKDLNDPTLIQIVQDFDKSEHKKANWLAGKNTLNTIVVRKSLFSSALYVIENDKVVYQKSISFLNKLKER